MSAAITLKAVGDLMLGDHPVCFGHGVRSTIERRGFDYIKGGLGNALKDSDIVFGNLETVLSNSGLNPKSLASAELRGRPQEASELATMGFNVVNLANNHALQHGLKAFEETVTRLVESRIDVVGLADGGRCEVKRLEKNGVAILLLSYSQRPEKYYMGETIPYARARDEVILTHVEDLRRENELPIVLSLHWGEEYLNYPSKSQISFAHSLVDAGANLILGHHPHVLQAVEAYKDAIIVYSLGNFIFDKWQRNPRESIVFSCRLTQDGILDYELIPILISRKYQPRIVSPKQGRKILDRVQKYTDALKAIEAGEGEFIDWDRRYQHMADNAYFRFRMESYLYFVSHLYRYSPGIILGSALRFLQRRLGAGTKVSAL